MDDIAKDYPKINYNFDTKINAILITDLNKKIHLLKVKQN
jgi:hypothetical protein